MVKSKGSPVHKSKATADKFAAIYRRNNLRCTVRKVKGGYRVDKY